MLIDAHTHIRWQDKQELKYLLKWSQQGFAALINTSSADAFDVLSKKVNQPLSFGIHPWDCQTVFANDNSSDGFKRTDLVQALWKDYGRYFKAAAAIGEIGLDTVWCDCPLEWQNRLFLAQLTIAKSLKKPIVLHTKGQELQIARHLLTYPYPKLIHWYAEPATLPRYIKQGAYFSIGVDLCVNPTTQSIAKAVPLNRLLLETDGSKAMQWALGEHLTYADTLEQLERNLVYLAELKGLKPKVLKEIIKTNFYCFLQKHV